MKKIIYILLMSIIATSCSDYLDKDAEKNIPAQDIDYTKTEDMHQVVVGVYSKYNYYMSSFMVNLLMNVRSDDTDKGAGNDRPVHTTIEQFKYDQVKTAYDVEKGFLEPHIIIIKANEAITVLNEYKKHFTKPEHTDLYNRYMGEIRFMRAHAYTVLTNLYGSVPMITHNDQLKANPPIVPVDEFRKFIIAETEFCANVLPAIRPNQAVPVGSVTKYSALGLKAKVCLYRGDYENAKRASAEIIDSKLFTLYPSYYQLFKIPGKLCDESLVELQFTDFGPGSSLNWESWYYFWSMGPIKNEWPIQGWGFCTPSDKLVKALDDRGETIRKQTLLLPANSTTPEGDVIGSNDLNIKYWAGKPYTPGNQMTPDRNGYYGDNNNVKMIRYADILLINAESRVRTGESGNVPYNLVRKRAEMSEKTVGEVTLDEIIEERRIELAMEWGERFFDLIRIDRAAQELPGFVKGKHEFLPIPQSQVDLNSSLRN